MSSGKVGVLLCLILVFALARNVEEWKKRTIYQLLTDRFNGGNGTDIHKYCGGTFRGIIEKLDYIAGMGFDAIWISPVIENTDGGYHGYWAKNFYAINPNFGTEEDLKELVRRCHEKDIWVMVDIVANHVGQGNISTFYPFNSFEDHYHDCSRCPAHCAISNWDDEWEVEHCQLCNLPDLKQEDPYVDKELKNWIRWLVKTFDIDGLRVDTLMEVDKTWWTGFCEAAGVYCLGEACNGNLMKVVPYQKYVDGVLSYPMFYQMRNVFGHHGSFFDIKSMMDNYIANFKDIYALGTFMDNHDEQRFLHYNPNWNDYKNAFTYTLFSAGIPIIYYGSEQGFDGGGDPGNREVMWGHFDVYHELYKYLAMVVPIRKKYEIYNYPQVISYSDDHFYAISRGRTLVGLTNTRNDVAATIQNHPFHDGETVCNALNPDDCITVQGGQLTITLRGVPKIYVPK